MAYPATVGCAVRTKRFIGERHGAHSTPYEALLAALNACALALVGQRFAFELDDALAVVFDGLRGHYAALVIFQFAA